MKAIFRIFAAFLCLIWMSIAAFAQVKVGDNPTAVDPSAVLELESTSKGILIPRVNLTSSTQDIDGVAGQAIGLLIFNNGSTIAKGFYYWNGTEWRSIDNSSAVPATVATLDCSSATLYPNSYTSGVAYTGTMSIPYAGGNGAVYTGGTPIASTGVTGLVATLQAGTLNIGTGNLIYTVTGTPSASSPSTASFILPTTMGATGCTAVVGIGNQFTVGQVQSTRIEVPAATFFTYGNTLHMNGKLVSNTSTVDERGAYDVSVESERAKFITLHGLRLDFLQSEVAGNIRPVFYNTTASPVTYTIATISTANSSVDGAGTTIASHYYSYRIDGNDDMSVTTSTYSEYVNCMLSFANGEWYNITFYGTRDATIVYLYMTAQRLN